LANKYSFGYRPRRAIKILKAAGFKRGSDGIFHDKRGRKLNLSIVNVGGYSDWVAENQIIAADLKQVGINLTVLELSGNTHSAREQQGQFQLAYDSPLGGPVPYYQFRQLLDSANSAPLGKLASSNYERFATQQVDEWFNQYAATKSPKVQKRIIDKLQSVMLTQLPVIPVLEGVNWYEYDTNDLTGWPTKQNEYAAPAAYNYPDQAQVLLSLHLK
jgi:peptide/nickel transport system substrate-binding protein